MASKKTLIGRTVERATLGRLLHAVRRADSRVLVLRGEPGVSKTAPLRRDRLGP
jgi:predicted ATPase